MEDFANSEYNTFKVDYGDGQGFKNSEKDSAGNIRQRFKEVYKIGSTKKQDEKIAKAASKEIKKPFSTLKSNCTHICEKGLDAGGLKNEEKTNGSKNYFPTT